MPDALSSIGGFFGKAAPAIEGITAGTGLLGNIMNSIIRGKEVGKLQDAEKRLASLTPEKLAGLVSRAEQPLGADLTQSVGNLVQADVAGRGLAESPGVFAATESQALAPYKLQQQQMALELVMKQLGLPIEYAKAILEATGGNVDVSKILALLQQNNSGGNQVPDTSGITSDVGSLVQQFIEGSYSPGFSQAPSEGYT